MGHDLYGSDNPYGMIKHRESLAQYNDYTIAMEKFQDFFSVEVLPHMRARGDSTIWEMENR